MAKFFVAQAYFYKQSCIQTRKYEQNAVYNLQYANLAQPVLIKITARYM